MGLDRPNFISTSKTFVPQNWRIANLNIFALLRFVSDSTELWLQINESRCEIFCS